MRNAFRLIIPLAGMLLTVSSTGCTPPPVDAKQTASPSAPLPPSSRGQDAAGYDLALDADPLVQPAWFASQAMKRSEVELRDHYANALRPKLDQARLGTDWEAAAAPLAAFLRASRSLQSMADDVIRADEAFQLIASRHRKDLLRAPPSYCAAAARWREKSEEETNRVLRETYAKFADNAEVLASLIEKRAQAFAKFESEVALAVKFTRKTRELLKDFEVFASLAPSLDAPDLRGQYRDHLKVYVRAFGDFLALHEEWSDSLRASPLPAKPTDPLPPKPAPQDSAPESRPHFVRYSSSSLHDPDAVAAASAETYGKSFAGIYRELLKEHKTLTMRIGSTRPEQLPPWLRAELESYKRRSKFDYSHVTEGGGVTCLSTTSDLKTGLYLPIIRGRENTYVGVIRVGPRLNSGQYSFTQIRGELIRPGDNAVQLPAR